MIKKFKEFLNEENKPSDCRVNITSSVMYPVRILLSEKDPPVTVMFAHPNMGATTWFTIDKNHELKIETTHTLVELVIKLQDVFENWTTFYYVHGKGASGHKEQGKEKSMKLLMENPYFGKWWKEVTTKYKSAITGKKFGL